MIPLEDRRIRDLMDWLDRLEPAWTMLDRSSVVALVDEPSPANGVMRLSDNLRQDELDLSPVARNALALIGAATHEGGLKLTAAGNLSRAGVAAMEEAMIWPDHSPGDARRYRKVFNESDFLQLHFLRTLMETAGLVEAGAGRLHASQLGQEMLDGNCSALQAILFHVALWHVDLASFGRGLLDTWPQDHIGVVLWSLSATAEDWQPAETLVRLCTIPCDEVVEQRWDMGSLVFQVRILRLLYWFGLLEHRFENEGIGSGTAMADMWRKSELFDRFLAFEVGFEDADAVRH